MVKAFHSKETKKSLRLRSGKVQIFHLPKLERLGFGSIQKLPFSVKVLLESALRNLDGFQVTFEDIARLSAWSPSLQKGEIAFKPARVILQDFTGVPCVVDLAAMRSALERMGGDYRKVNPLVPCDLVIDHSVQVDAFGSKKAFGINLSKEFKRNKERYEFLKWGQSTFKNFRVVPPATGIIHQVNLEYLTKGVLIKRQEGDLVAYPDSLVGTDSHTTMINGIGVVGWGVGGIEAEAVMLGEPLYMLLPEVVGFKLRGYRREGVTATDLVLTVTQVLRERGVVGKFVEFFGEGIRHLTLADRATVSNMAPEYGATMGIFPVDDETIRYYKMTGRKPSNIDLIERYFKEQEMFVGQESVEPEYSQVIELDMSTVKPCVAGPKRPQDRINLESVKVSFYQSLTAPLEQRGFGLVQGQTEKTVRIRMRGDPELRHGSVLIAAITSCTNTSNPSVLIGAGLLAQNAVKLGLRTKGFVKTSFAPGSRVVTEYLKDSNLLRALEKLGFHVIGYGCTTCIGNSGSIPEKIAAAIQDRNLIVASVSSGNRNFEGRIHPLTKANYLASPALVIAYALAGRVDIDFDKEPIGKRKNGKDIFLKDIWPSETEINKIVKKVVVPKIFREQYKTIFSGNAVWKRIKAKKSELYAWRKQSTYIQEPPFFRDVDSVSNNMEEILGARVLVMLGDSVTTDHISPAGVVAFDSPAGKYLRQHNIPPEEFNSYGSRRGNDQVMTRGTFANIRIRNRLVPGSEGSWTIHFPTEKKMSIYEAAHLYRESHIPLLVLAGKEYGMGSSRDWAAKGTALLGVRVVLAQSFERIHRSNLVGMGVLPLEFKAGDSWESLSLDGTETYDFLGLNNNVKPRQDIKVVAMTTHGSKKEFKATLRLDTPVEINYYRNGGILPTVLRKLASK